MNLKPENKTKVVESGHVTTSFNAEASFPNIKSSNAPGSKEAVVLPPSKAQTSAVSTRTETTSKSTPKAASPTKPIYKPVLKPTAQTAPRTADDARRLDIENISLRFDTIAAALGDGLMGREPLEIPHDDVKLVKNATNSKAWVKKLIEAFGKDYLATSEEANKNSPSQQEWFTRWQKQAHINVVAIYEAKAADHLEKSCWHLFDAVIKFHELGVVNAANQSTWASSDLKCSERLAFIVSIIEKYALIRLDILRSWHVDEIAANPEAFIKRKIVNCWNNGRRAERLSKAVADSEASEKGSGKKRAAREEQTDQQGSVDGIPGKGKKVRKSLPVGQGERRAKGEGKGEGEGEGESKSAIKRPHSTAVQNSEDKNSTSKKLPATAKVTPENVAKSRGGEESDGMDED